MSIVQCSCGSGAFSIQAKALFCGKDLTVCVTGGTAPHVGAVSLATYEPERDSATVSTVCVHSHRDDLVSAHFAKTLSRALRCTVCVSAGIHVDDAAEAELLTLWQNSVDCCQSLLAAISKEGTP